MIQFSNRCIFVQINRKLFTSNSIQMEFISQIFQISDIEPADSWGKKKGHG